MRMLREKMGYSQQAVADAINISRLSYVRYESGERTPNANIIQSIADLYDVSVDYLLGRTDIPNIYKAHRGDEYEVEVWSPKKLSPAEREQLMARADEMKNTGAGVTVPPGLDQKALEAFVRQVVDQAFAERDRSQPDKS